jgi:hypothetical protein
MDKRIMIVLGLGFFILLASWDFEIFGLDQEAVAKTEAGIPIVYNPKEPVGRDEQPVSLTLKLDFSIGDDSGDENYMFSEMGFINVDDQENIYIIDWKETKIKVFDKYGKHVRSFGKKGQGPGELGMPQRMELLPGNKLVVSDSANAKFVFFSLDGEFIKDVPMGRNRFLGRFRFDSDGCVYTDTRTYDEKKTIAEFKKFDPDFNPVATFASVETTREPRVVNAFTPTLLIQMTSGENLVWGVTSEYQLTLMDRNGKILKKIVKDYEPVKITKEHEKKLILDTWGERGIRPGIKFEIPSHFPAIQYITIDDEDRLFVRTYDYQEIDGEYAERYDIFDAEGRYIAKFFHPADEVIFWPRKNKMYSLALATDEDVEMLKRYSMIWK